MNKSLQLCFYLGGQKCKNVTLLARNGNNLTFKTKLGSLVMKYLVFILQQAWHNKVCNYIPRKESKWVLICVSIMTNLMRHEYVEIEPSLDVTLGCFGWNHYTPTLCGKLWCHFLCRQPTQHNYWISKVKSPFYHTGWWNVCR